MRISMNTVDKLVEIIDKCVVDGCHSGCPFEKRCLRDNKQELLSEALHHLKEYQKIEDEYEELKDWWAEEHAENVPLSWDELKEMEGKPVWIWISPRVKNTPGSGHWAIVYRFNPIGGNKNLFEMQMENGSRYKRKYQGDLWQAYRKERK